MPTFSIYSHERAVRESQLTLLASKENPPISEEPTATQMSDDRRIRVSLTVIQMYHGLY